MIVHVTRERPGAQLYFWNPFATNRLLLPRRFCPPRLVTEFSNPRWSRSVPFHSAVFERENNLNNRVSRHAGLLTGTKLSRNESGIVTIIAVDLGLDRPLSFKDGIIRPCDAEDGL